MYFKGQGVEKNYKEAFSLWQQAASLGSANGAFNLGQCFSAGAGSPKDKNKAVYWLEIALERRHPLASKRLSEIQQKRQ
jgi:TPR repeat protein